MGLLTELIRQEFEKKRQDKEIQLQGYGALLKQPDLKPDARDRVLAQMGKSAGSGKPVVDLLGAVLKKHGKQQAAPQESEPGPGVPSESGITRESATGADDLPETHTRVRVTSPGEAPSRGSRYSPGEMAYMDKQATEQKQQQEIQQKVQLQTALATAKRTSDRANEGEEMQSKITRVKELDARTDIDDSTRESLKQQIIGAKAETGAWKEDALILANGTAMPVLMKGDKFHTLDGKEFTPPAGTTTASAQKLSDEHQRAIDEHKKETEPKPTTPPKPTGELGERLQAQEIVDHPDKHTPTEVTAAKATIKHLDTVEKGATVRIEAGQVAASGGAQIPASAVGKTGEESLEGQPDSIKNLVKNVAMYNQPFPYGMAAGRPPWSTVAELLGPYSNWQYNAQKYQQAQHMRTEYTNTMGTHTGAKILSLNTLVQHLGTFDKAVDALQANDTQAVNRFVNFMRTQTGNSKVTNMETAKTAISDELATALKQTGATDVTINQWRDNFRTASSPEQFKGSIQEAYHLMAGRLKPMKEEYEGVLGKVDIPIVHPASRQGFKAHGINPDTLEEEGGQGGTTHFVEGADHWDIPADKVEAFKKKHPKAQ